MKNILITGANGGIGSEIAKSFAQPSNRLILIFHKKHANIDSLVKNLSRTCEIAVYRCDLANSLEVKNTFSDIEKKYKHIDVLVNVAGVSVIKQIQNTTDKDYNFVMDNNFRSVFNLSRLVAKNMISFKTGRIINISSMWGRVGASMESVYSASKGAINAFTLSLAKELGPSGITVNAICPGLINTEMNSKLDEQSLQQIIDETPISRIGQPKDVASLVYFLASDSASFITGQIISVDGGLSI